MTTAGISSVFVAGLNCLVLPRPNFLQNGTEPTETEPLDGGFSGDRGLSGSVLFSLAKVKPIGPVLWRKPLFCPPFKKPGRGDNCKQSLLSTLGASSIDPLSWAMGGDDVGIGASLGAAVRALASDIFRHAVGRCLDVPTSADNHEGGLREPIMWHWWPGLKLLAVADSSFIWVVVSLCRY